MYSKYLNAATVALLAAQATAKTVKIDVGQSGLTFTPSTVQADKGDTLEFHFYSTHSVAMSDYKSPCTPSKSGGFFSGVQMAGEGSDMVFHVMVNSTDPIFYYCTVDGHCQGGMVGTVNPTSDETLEKYKTAAQDATSGKAPTSAFGGTLVKSGSSGSSSGSSGGSSSAAGTGSGSESMSATMSAASTMASGASGGSMTTEMSGSSSGSQTAAAASSSTSSAAGAMQATFGGIGAVALGFAALMV